MIYDEGLDIQMLEAGDMIYFDGVTAEVTINGKGYDTGSFALDEADIYFVDPITGDSHPVHWLTGQEANSRGIVEDDERYGKMFVEL